MMLPGPCLKNSYASGTVMGTTDRKYIAALIIILTTTVNLRKGGHSKIGVWTLTKSFSENRFFANNKGEIGNSRNPTAVAFNLKFRSEQNEIVVHIPAAFYDDHIIVTWEETSATIQARRRCLSTYDLDRPMFDSLMLLKKFRPFNE
uniref:Uncharacterized protein n=1 Tax=Romanomermis culicivorax TaxID=13658 RepID=A0A915JSR2_ROMCU